MSGVERGAGDFVVSGCDEWLHLNNFSGDAIDRGEPTDTQRQVPTLQLFPRINVLQKREGTGDSRLMYVCLCQLLQVNSCDIPEALPKDYWKHVG